MKRALLTRAKRKILLADASKWGSPSTVRFAGWRDFDDWIVDQAPAKAELAALKKGGVRVHRAAA